MQQAPQSLPIESVLDELRSQLDRHRLVILEAPPGTGKTTRVPNALLEGGMAGQIWVLEPRRLAARWAARWVAQLRQESLGETVGYQVRLDSCSSPKTRLFYMTQGVFARRLLENRDLMGIGLVVLDEFHERSLDNDFALAWLRSHGSCKILIMSATLPPKLAEQLEGAALVRCPSPLFPVATQHQISLDPLEKRLAESLPHSQGSGLVFLPGMREIRSCAKALDKLATRHGAELQILHGSLDSGQQDRVLQANPQSKRWILTTNVAETSLTVPGVSWVIDSGLARTPMQPPGAPLSRLETVRISRFAAEQRTGRAGRLGPGQCLRLYSQQDFASRPQAETPEILRRDLCDLVLHWLHLGSPDLQWLDEPPEAAWEAALRLLEQLSATQNGRLTRLGNAMAQLPLEPRLARFLLGYPQRLGIRAAAWLARGGDFRQSDLEEAMTQATPPLPEERQLRPPTEFAVSSLEEALLHAFPDRVAQVRRGQDLVMCDGSGYRLSRPIAGDPWLLALQLELDGDRQLRLSAYHTLSPEMLLDRPELVEDSRLEWNAQAGRAEEQLALRYGELILEQSRRRARPGPKCANLLRPYALDSAWWQDQQLRRQSWEVRHHFASRVDANLPPLPKLETWLEQVCLHCSSLAELTQQRWEKVLSPRVRARIEELCPQWVSLGRRRVEVHYEEGKDPWMAAKLIDFFGLHQGPQLAQGKIPLVMHLLAPNFRPVQITQDLAGFWQKHYSKVRSELCRRYPRHPWPEDPLNPQKEEMKPKRRS